jgi:hypothetical protein
MIKLFRNIRQNLLNEGKTSKYFKYAIGEIVLVVIGILIALGINNWNQNRIKTLQEFDSLKNLKTELQNNIKDLKKKDSLYSDLEKVTATGIEMFNNKPNVQDFKIIDTLIKSRLTVFPLTRSTYDEMLNTGNFYNLKNKKLGYEINTFYSNANSYFEAFLLINKDVLQLNNHSDLFSYYLLMDKLKTIPPNLKEIDTSWVHDINSKTYLTFFKRANYIQELSNHTRRQLMATQIKSCKELIIQIDNELDKRNP